MEGRAHAGKHNCGALATSHAQAPCQHTVFDGLDDVALHIIFVQLLPGDNIGAIFGCYLGRCHNVVQKWARLAQHSVRSTALNTKRRLWVHLPFEQDSASSEMYAVACQHAADTAALL